MKNDKNPDWPRTVEEAVDNLLSVLGDKSKKKLLKISKDDLIRFHMSWGMGIRNEFGLWGGNQELMDSCGVEHPDSASMVIMKAVWDRLHNK